MRKISEILKHSPQVSIALAAPETGVEDDIVAMDQPIHTIKDGRALIGKLAREFAIRMDAPLSEHDRDEDCTLIVKSTTSVSSIKSRTPSGFKLMEAYVSGLVIMHETTASRCLKAINNPVGLLTITDESIDPTSIDNLTHPITTHVIQKQPAEIDMRWRVIDRMTLDALRI